MEKSAFVYSAENNTGLGALSPIRERSRPRTIARKPVSANLTTTPELILHREHLIQPKPSVQPVQDENPVNPDLKSPKKLTLPTNSFNFSEFYKKNKKMVLIGGGIGGSLLLLMLLK